MILLFVIQRDFPKNVSHVRERKALEMFINYVLFVTLFMKILKTNFDSKTGNKPTQNFKLFIACTQFCSFKSVL